MSKNYYRNLRIERENLSFDALELISRLEREEKANYQLLSELKKIILKMV